jgi:protein-S-isoprenylcysteine O-methyltransferase Ste14
MQALEHRIPPPLVWLLVAAAMWGVARLTPAFDVPAGVRFTVAAVLALFGLLCAAPAIIGFRRAGTTVNPVDIEQASALVTGGIYRYTRNPMYLGLTCLLLAWTVWLAAPWSALGPVAFVLFITRFQIIPEERVMQAKFGRAYAEYRARTRRWA